jgi:multidrug efflux system membrane fusion protein
MHKDRSNVDNAKLQLTYAQVTAPITGVVGLRLVDAGNIVHAANATGIVIITQSQPIAVLFNIADDSLPEVRARLSEGARLSVEAWTRDNSRKIATGRLTTVDNQIDQTTGTAKLKAVFDNKDTVPQPVRERAPVLDCAMKGRLGLLKSMAACNDEDGAQRRHLDLLPVKTP